MGKKTIWIIVLAICLGVFVACAAYFVNSYFQSKKIENLRDEVFIPSKETTESKAIANIINFFFIAL